MTQIKATTKSKRQHYHDTLMDLIVDMSKECHIQRAEAFSIVQCWAYRGSRRWIGGRNLYTGKREST